MGRLPAVDPATVTARPRKLLESVKAKLGSAPNMMRAMAVSPAVLEGYLALDAALSRGTLSPRLREQIALAVAESNQCDYSRAAHAVTGKMVGLSNTELVASRRGTSAERHAAAALEFACAILKKRGGVTEDDLVRIRRAGYGDAEITEIVANVALNVFTNYFNRVARTEIDF